MDGEPSEGAARELLHYYNEIRDKLCQIVRCQSLGEELAQETYCRALHALARNTRVRNVPAWLHAIARNVMRSHYQRAATRIPLEETNFDGLEDPRQADPIEELEQSDLRAKAVGKAMNSLRPLARALVVGFYIDGKGCEALGNEFGLRRRTVNYRLYHARRRLRNGWNKKPGGCNE